MGCSANSASQLLVSLFLLGNCVAHPLAQDTLEEPRSRSEANSLMAYLVFSTEILPVTESLILSLRSDRGLTYSANGVVQWLNPISGQSATVVESGNSPTLLSSDPIMNGRPSVVFSAAGMEYLNLNLSDTVTSFIAFRNSGTGTKVVFEHGEDTNEVSGGGMYLSTSNSNTIAYRRGPGNFSTTMTAKNTVADWGSTNEAMIVSVVYAGNHDSHNVRINGQQPVLFENPPFQNNPTGSFNASFYFGGRPRPVNVGEFLHMEGAISEILVYDRSLSLDEIQNVEHYLLKRYRP